LRQVRTRRERRHEPRRVLVWQRPDERGVHEPEDGHVCGEADSQRDDRGCGEGAIFPELTQGESNVLTPPLDEGSKHRRYSSMDAAARVSDIR
jgi:hypothetical protein